MKSRLRCLLGAIFFLTPPSVPAANLGDPAPPISIQYWVKGQPVKIAANNTNRFVVEFWATWCPPCRKSIPHLTQLQKKYADRGVIFVGISDEPLATVSEFVKNQGGNMEYHVAVDPTKRTMNAWFAAYGQNGIPHAFVLNTDGTVLWHGFPAEKLDQVLDSVLKGTYNLEAERTLETGDRLVQQYTAMVSKGTTAAAAAPTGNRIMADYASKDWRIPYRLADAIMTDPDVRAHDYNLALRASSKAVELTRERSYQALAVHARALLANSKRVEALEAHKKAIALCNDAQDKPELEKLLPRFEKAAQLPATPAKPSAAK